MTEKVNIMAQTTQGINTTDHDQMKTASNNSNNNNSSNNINNNINNINNPRYCNDRELEENYKDCIITGEHQRTASRPGLRHATQREDWSRLERERPPLVTGEKIHCRSCMLLYTHRHITSCSCSRTLLKRRSQLALALAVPGSIFSLLGKLLGSTDRQFLWTSLCRFGRSWMCRIRILNCVECVLILAHHDLTNRQINQSTNRNNLTNQPINQSKQSTN